jgi:acyl-CoA dehydrogenase
VKFADFLLDESERLLRNTSRKFAEAEILPHAQKWEEEEWFDGALFEKAASAGLLGVGFPEELGGSGGHVLHQIMVVEGLLRGGSSGVVAGLGSLGIALPPIVMLGTSAQKDAFVRPTLAGQRVAALAVTEPGAGSDVAGLTTRAVRDGNSYVLHGTKTFITSGARADFVVVLCRTSSDPHGGLTFFAVERGTEGFGVSKALKKTGWRASDTAELYFDAVRVPESHRIGPEGSGFLAVMRNFQNERLALAAYGHASATIALEEALRYTRERRAFGKPLAGFQVTRHKLADMATEVLSATTLNYALARQVAAGAYLVSEVSMAKNLSARVAERVCYEAVQLHGGLGFMRESLVERLSRDVRILAIGGGTTEVMKEIISKALA